jgi:hypothetical protein
VKENPWRSRGEILKMIISKLKVPKSTRAPNAPTALNFRNLSRSWGLFKMLLIFIGD